MNTSITHPSEQDTREQLNLQDYKYLGYQNSWKHVYFDENNVETTDNKLKRSFGYRKDDYPEYMECINCGHNKDNTIKSIQHNPRGSNVTYWCPIHKIFWKVDMSD